MHFAARRNMMGDDIANLFMGAAQQLLFPDPRPLVERLGSEFFRELPDCPGVYLMRDAGNAVLYVGKAMNLRKRLRSYRVANPDRLARRHLRLLRSVARIELEPCANEAVALAREAELLLQLRPRFNRAGTWPGKARYFAWRCVEDNLPSRLHKPNPEKWENHLSAALSSASGGEGDEIWGLSQSLETTRSGSRGILVLAVTESPVEGWKIFGPLGGGAIYLRAVLARLIWVVANPELSVTSMPAGWLHHQFEEETVIHCGEKLAAANELIEELLVRQTGGFCAGLRKAMRADLHPFEKALIEENLEHIAAVFPEETEDGSDAADGSKCQK